MYAKDLVVDNHAQSQEIEHIREVMPNIRIPILSRALRIESIRLRNSSRFMISSYQVHAMRISKLETNKKRNGLHTEHASINVISCSDLETVRDIS